MPHRSPSPSSSANRSEHFHQSTSAKLYNGISTLSSAYPSLRTSERFKRDAISACLTWPLDRVNVLGNDNGYHVGGGDGDAYGHTGCVNALSWARDGELLLSGGDDRTVRVWRMDQTNDDPEQPFPFTCRSVIRTGHQANIFNNKMLPHSSRILDLTTGLSVTLLQGCTTYSTAEACTHVIRCHRGAVKRIITEHSPDLFLSVSEDGTVRQHDLRAKHPCRRKDGNCPTPIVKVDFELMSMSLSPLTPHQLIVAGESDYGYLFDRRHSGRFLQEEWGVPPFSASTECLTTCVRRFGRPRREGESEDNGGRLLGLGNHITGCKMSASNGHEAIFSFSADAVYLYSTLDDPTDGSTSRRSSIVPSNEAKERKDNAASVSGKRSTSRGSGRRSISRSPRERPSHWPSDSDMERDIDEMAQPDDMDEDEGRDMDESGDQSDSDDEEEEHSGPFPDVPTVMPRRRFAGAKNIRTVKDVNYLGPSDEFVVSGSDDGNLFIWRKDDGKLVDILEGDGEVVNVIEGHPKLPLFAVSGIDTTLFAPKPRSRGPPLFSKLSSADSILEANSHQTPLRSLDESMLLSLAMHARRALGSDGSPTLECTNQ
ncbi:WD40 repeat-like protein [Schizophyllum commune Loenen D]|nr:WD40 repeat-like protein [Schizophyllum commune Loenen D]